MSTSVLQTLYKNHSLERNAVKCIFSTIIQSWWLCSLRRVSVVVHLLRLWVRIPPQAWTSVCCECYVLLGGHLCNGLITRPWSPTIYGVLLSVTYKPPEWGHCPHWASLPERKKTQYMFSSHHVGLAAHNAVFIETVSSKTGELTNKTMFTT